MRTVREAIADGEIPADTDAEMLRSMVYGAIEHRMWGTLFGHGSIDVEDTADRFTRMIVDPLVPPAHAAPATADLRTFITDLRERLDGFELALTRETRETTAARPRRDGKRKARS
jgi:hypothetical protein